MTWPEGRRCTGRNKFGCDLSKDENQQLISEDEESSEEYNSENDSFNSFQQDKSIEQISNHAEHINTEYDCSTSDNKSSLHHDSYQFLHFTICIIIPIICVITFTLSNGSKEPLTITHIHQKFPLQPKDSLESIETIIDDVLRIVPIHPAVFLFIYDNDKRDHNDFIETIANFASEKLGVNEGHITLNELDYTHPKVKKDYGYLIDKYKSDLDLRKVMVIKNLHKMDGKTAQALHSFCDEYTPLVDRAIYILTLKVNSFKGSEMHIAEEQLYKIWNELENDILAPLITRVTSTVIKVY